MNSFFCCFFDLVRGIIIIDNKGENMKKKLIYIGSLILVTVIVSITYFSYAFITHKDEYNGKINVVTGTLNYKIESKDLNNNSITLSAGEEKEIEVTLTSLNPIESKYQLYYNNISDVEVGYLDETDTTTGTISAKGTKKIKLILRNDSNTNKTITLGAKGGLVNNSLTLASSELAINVGEPICQIGQTYDFPFDPDGDGQGQVQEFTAKCSGIYKIETWGAQGGDIGGYTGGKGGYSSGTISLIKDSNLFIYVGQAGVNYASAYNGGGYGAASGGGMTDIRTIAGIWNNSDSLNSQIIVAGGGGGANNRGSGYGEGNGGAGGGTNGIAGTSTNNTNGFGYGLGDGGHQTSGGNFHWSGGTSGIAAAQYTTWTYNSQQSPIVAGTRGQGGNGVADQSGGGGGYYGGAGAAHGGAGGGSGYVGGVIDGETIAGNQTITEPDGTTATGHSGDGYARITYLSSENYVNITARIYSWECNDTLKTKFVYTNENNQVITTQSYGSSTNQSFSCYSDSGYESVNIKAKPGTKFYIVSNYGTSTMWYVKSDSGFASNSDGYGSTQTLDVDRVYFTVPNTDSMFYVGTSSRDSRGSGQGQFRTFEYCDGGLLNSKISK